MRLNYAVDEALLVLEEAGAFELQLLNELRLDVPDFDLQIYKVLVVNLYLASLLERYKNMLADFISIHSIQLLVYGLDRFNNVDELLLGWVQVLVLHEVKVD